MIRVLTTIYENLQSLMGVTIAPFFIIHQNPPKPDIFLNCSYVTQKVNCHGPNRVQVGKNPLYSAKTPSAFTDFTKQSKLDLYIAFC